MTITKQERLNIPPNLEGIRIDKALATLLPNYSRTQLQQWIREGYVLVNTKSISIKDKVKSFDLVQITARIPEKQPWQAQELPVTKLYEDEDVIVVNKPAGLVVHPGAGNDDHTLVNALLHYAPELAELPRAGIVHRLDKDTSGVLVVARTLSAKAHLVAQFQKHEIVREYQTIVTGVLVAGGTVNANIGRHPKQRLKMAVVASGKSAITHYRVMQRYRAHTLVRVHLETGRTHQIRVHLAHIRYPVLGDSTYGGRLQMPVACSAEFQETLRSLKRQALHATRLGFIHPSSGRWMYFTANLPEDMLQLLAILEQDKQEHA